MSNAMRWPGAVVLAHGRSPSVAFEPAVLEGASPEITKRVRTVIERRVQWAEHLMGDFVARTVFSGVDANRARRYLWTDAFAVFALSALYCRTREVHYADWTRALIDSVHHVLGRFRPDDLRSGWISGLAEAEGERHPTVGGLRIGKPLPERRSDERADEQLEWERDGQYFHYLTKWMHALDRAAVVLGERRYLEWAIELARAAHRGFVHRPVGSSTTRMYWKMSTDLSRPTVPSMGQLDPLDGLVTFGRLQSARCDDGIDLGGAITELHGMCDGIDCWATTDPLGIGGLLTDAGGLVEMMAAGHRGLDGLLDRILTDLERSLEALAVDGSLALPIDSRLAFRELGLAIGLRSLDSTRAVISANRERFGRPRAAAGVIERLARLSRFSPLAERIEATWLAPAAQRVRSWTAHEDINAVMLATCLVPGVYLLPAGVEANRPPVGGTTCICKENSR